MLRAARADPARRRYELLAPVYDITSGERRLYAAARDRAAAASGRGRLDVACRTGRNFELIEQRIGPSGRLVGIDRCPRMLARARAREATHGWDNVLLAGTDAEQLTPNRLEALGPSHPVPGSMPHSARWEGYVATAAGTSPTGSSAVAAG